MLFKILRLYFTNNTVHILYKTNQLMIFRKVIVVYWITIHGVWIHRVANTELLSLAVAGRCSYYWVLSV